MLPLKTRFTKPESTLIDPVKMGLLYLPTRANSLVLKLTMLGFILLMSLVSCQKDDETNPEPKPFDTSPAVDTGVETNTLTFESTFYQRMSSQEQKYWILKLTN